MSTIDSSMNGTLAEVMQKEQYPSHTPKGSMRTQDIDFSMPKPAVPKGCKEYFFDKDGAHTFTPSNNHVFSCVASNEKNAIRKFRKHIEHH